MDKQEVAIKLDGQGTTLLNHLVGLLPKIVPGQPGTYPTYKSVHDDLKLTQLSDTYGKSLQQQGLNSLANWAKANDKPAITGLIVTQESHTPGPGFFKLYDRPNEDFLWWKAQIESAKQYDWTPYLGLSTEPATSKKDRSAWPEEELKAAVEMYIQMLRLHRAGEPYTKKAYYERLAEQYGRSVKAYEYRMQNISFVLSLMGREWLAGLKPAKNVGVNVAVQIERLIAEAENIQLAPSVGFDMLVNDALQNKKLKTPPSGSAQPKSSTATVTQYHRDPEVKAWVLLQAKGSCECCEKPAPFVSAVGEPFLEVHHVKKLAEQGSDTTSNAVALCPNCHRALHYGSHAKELIEGLYARITRLRRE